MIQRQKTASPNYDEQPTTNHWADEKAHTVTTAVAHLSEQELAQLAAKVYQLLRKELQVERDRGA